MVARQRRPPPVVSTQRVSSTPFPNGKGVKSKQAWKYPGYNIVRASTVFLPEGADEKTGRYYTDPKEDGGANKSKQGQKVTGDTSGTPRRKQESNFFVTINPNIQFSDTDKPKAEQQFMAAINSMSDNQTIARILKFGPKDEFYIQDKPADVICPGIEWKGAVETGEKLNRMHGHIITYIQHYSQIQVDPRRLQYEFRTAFNNAGPVQLTKNPYVQVKMLPQSNWTTIMRQYIHKGMGV